MSSQVSDGDLHKHTGEILDAVVAGESWTVTRDDRPVAQLVPVVQLLPDLPLSRPAVTRGGFSALRRHRIGQRGAATIAELRSDWTTDLDLP